MGSALLVFGFWYIARPLQPESRLRSNVMLGVVLVQVSMGILTLLLVVPIPLAAAHQAGAVLLMIAAIWVRHGLRST